MNCTMCKREFTIVSTFFKCDYCRTYILTDNYKNIIDYRLTYMNLGLRGHKASNITKLYYLENMHNCITISEPLFKSNYLDLNIKKDINAQVKNIVNKLKKLKVFL